MNHYLESVKEFHESFDHPVNHTIQTDNLKLRKLRLDLIFEETVELAHAMGVSQHLEELCEQHKKGTHNWLFNGMEPGEEEFYNKRESLDALCDIQYVLSGAILSLGYTDIFDDAFNEVQRSNMSKMCNNINEAEETILYHKDRKGDSQVMNIVKKEDKYIVVRDDGKILKSKYYSPADLETFIK